MTTIRSLHHVQITVPKEAEAEARQFYLQVLGLTEIPKLPSLVSRGGFWIQLGEQQIHISLEDGIDRHQTKAHIAYQVDDIDAWQRKLEGQHISISDSIPIDGYQRFEFRDPFGNRVEFIKPIFESDSTTS
jgi:catechol 2,3-dioxygenase-like lactoylglutathione lyase family enzyme